MTTSDPSAVWPQTLVGAGVLLTGLALAFGAIGISSEAGYGGVGPNFLPWLVSIVLTSAAPGSSGKRAAAAFASSTRPRRRPRLLARLRLGLGGPAAQRGADHHHRFHPELHAVLRAGRAGLAPRERPGRRVNAPRTWVIDFVTGLLIAAPVFWMFTQFLAINLPGLTATGVALTWKSSMP
jgi:putative tricarboxylic transport membrane protein